MSCCVGTHGYRRSYTSITGTAAVSGTNLLITPSSAVTITDESRVSIVVTGSVPTAGKVLPVTITVGGADIPVYDKYGNILYGTSIKPGCAIRGYYGVNGSGGTAHIIAINLPCACNCY